MVLINVFTKLKSINTLLTTALKHLLQTSIAPEIKPAWSVLWIWRKGVCFFLDPIFNLNLERWAKTLPVFVFLCQTFDCNLLLISQFPMLADQEKLGQREVTLDPLMDIFLCLVLLNRKREKLTPNSFSVCCLCGQESQWGLVELLEVLEEKSVSPVKKCEPC